MCEHNRRKAQCKVSEPYLALFVNAVVLHIYVPIIFALFCRTVAEKASASTRQEKTDARTLNAKTPDSTKRNAKQRELWKGSALLYITLHYCPSC